VAAKDTFTLAKALYLGMIVDLKCAKYPNIARLELSKTD
jgi:hypothetical protein